jgi:arylsulfate sulfotransferase
MQISGKKFVAIAFILLSVSCADFPRSDPPPDDTQDSSEESIIQNDSYVLNPYGVAPLSGIINIETKVPVQVRVTVSGNNEKDDIVKVFDSLETEHEIPVLGLYPGAINIVQVDFLNGEGAALKTKAYTFSTRSLDYKLPQIVVNAADYLRMSDGWTFVSYYGDLPAFYVRFGRRHSLVP